MEGVSINEIGEYYNARIYNQLLRAKANVVDVQSDSSVNEFDESITVTTNFYLNISYFRGLKVSLKMSKIRALLKIHEGVIMNFKYDIDQFGNNNLNVVMSIPKSTWATLAIMAGV